MDRAATAGAAGEVRAKAAEAISGRRGSSGSEAWPAATTVLKRSVDGARRLRLSDHAELAMASVSPSLTSSQIGS